MPKLPECDRCLFCAHDYHLVCAIHPAGVEEDSCLDFRPDPELGRLPFRDFLGVRRSRLSVPPSASRQRDDELYTSENLQMGTIGSQIARSQQNNEPYSNPHDYLNDDEELWEPEGASYYNGELILQPEQRWTTEEQLELLD